LYPWQKLVVRKIGFVFSLTAETVEAAEAIRESYISLLTPRAADRQTCPALIMTNWVCFAELAANPNE
jgi:hypothetical protein